MPALLLLGALPLLPPEKPLTVAEALKSVGQANIVVRFRVQHAKNALDRRGVVYLDSEADFRDPQNLGVALSASAVEQLKAAGVEDLVQHFQGKQIEVRGCVMIFGDQPFLPVLESRQIRVVGEK